MVKKIYPSVREEERWQMLNKTIQGWDGLDVGNNLSVDGDHISVADLKPETSRHLLDI